MAACARHRASDWRRYVHHARSRHLRRRADRRVSPRKANLLIAALRIILGLAVKREMIPSNPAA